MTQKVIATKEQTETEYFLIIDSLLTDARSNVEDAHTRIKILTAQTMLFNFLKRVNKI